MTLMLSALDITERTKSLSEIILLPPFSRLPGSNEELHGLAVSKLLNRVIQGTTVSS
jgi:hypothetical protein